MAGFRWRFRKSFTIIPKLLKFTINKKSWSINFKLGPYSRSWGSARSTSGLDMPGEYGLYMHKDHRRNHPEDKQGGFDALITVGFFLTILLHCFIGIIQSWILPFLSQSPSLHPNPLLWLVLIAIEISVAWQFRKSAPGLVLFLILGSIVYWLAFAALVV